MIVMGFLTWGMVELIRSGSPITFLEAGSRKGLGKEQKAAVFNSQEVDKDAIVALIAKLEAQNQMH